LQQHWTLKMIFALRSWINLYNRFVCISVSGSDSALNPLKIVIIKHSCHITL
jgi:hypothetical protein